MQYKELTALLQVVDGTQDSASSLSKAATVHQLLAVESEKRDF